MKTDGQNEQFKAACRSLTNLLNTCKYAVGANNYEVIIKNQGVRRCCAKYLQILTEAPTAHKAHLEARKIIFDGFLDAASGLEGLINKKGEQKQ